MFLKRLILVLFGYFGFSNSQNVAQKYDYANCELPGAKCAISINANKVMVKPLILNPLTGAMRSHPSNMLEFDSGEQIVMSCQGENNNLYYAKDNAPPNHIRDMSLLTLKCVCGTLVKSLCSVIDANYLMCQKGNSEDA